MQFLPNADKHSRKRKGNWTQFSASATALKTCSLFQILITHNWPPLWSSGQSSWLQIQMSGFDFQRRHIFWEVMGLERGPLSLVSTTGELLGRESCGSGLETEITAVRIHRADYATTLYPKNLALTSPAIGGRSVGIVRSRTKATELFLVTNIAQNSTKLKSWQLLVEPDGIQLQAKADNDL
jgi:hypothetical protein